MINKIISIARNCLGKVEYMDYNQYSNIVKQTDLHNWKQSIRTRGLRK